MGIINSPFGEVPYPDEEAAYDVPADFSNLVEAIDSKLIGVAYSTADRDSKFYAAPAGFVVKVVNPDDHPTNPDEYVGLYVKSVKAGMVSWNTLDEPSSTLVEQPLQLVDGYEPRDGSYMPTVLKESSNFMVLNGAVVKSDASLIASGSTVAYLPATGFTPYRRADYPCATTYIGSAQGSYKVTVTNDTLAIIYFGPSVNWVGFDNIRIRTVN